MDKITQAERDLYAIIEKLDDKHDTRQLFLKGIIYSLLGAIVEDELQTYAKFVASYAARRKD